MKMSKVLWTKEQLAAIETENSNIIVSAGAGSGKTAVLTTRIINKLKNGISANQLLVLTFTNAAAAEMKNRIIDKMKEDNALKSKISEVENAYITTFDSFAYSMVKKYHYLFNLSKNIHILDSSIFYLVEKQFLSEIFLSLYESKDSSFLNMIDRFTIKDDAEIIQSILNIYKKFDQIIDKQTYLSNYLPRFFSDEMLAQYKKDFFELIFSKLNEASLIFEEVLLPLIKKQDEINAYYQLFDSKYYDLLVDSLLSIKTLRIITEDEEIKKEKKHFDSIIKEIKDLCIYANEKEIDFALNDAIQYEKVILNILQTLDSKVISYKRKYEAFEFNDIAKMALDIVKNHPDIQENLKNQFHEILIDEYQDTNDLQEAFISYIENHNVYMVGDVKQSIYRFRNANPEIFIKKYNQYQQQIDGFKIDLTNNFRSNRAIIETINHIFSIIMKKEIGGTNYQDGHQMKFGFTTYDTYQTKHNIEYITYQNEQKKFKDSDIELFYVVQDILQKINDQQCIYDSNLKKVRACTFKDFAILLEKSKEADRIQKLLNYYQIPTTILKNDNLIEGDLFYVVFNILTAITKIYNQEFDSTFLKAYYGIHRSFLIRATDEEAYDHIVNKTYYQSTLFLKLKQFVLKIPQLSNKEFILEIIKEFNFYENLIYIGNIDINSNKIKQICEIADNLSVLDISTLKMADYFQMILKEKIKIEIPSTSSVGNTVKIMTIHKSKGLEFPTCYFIFNYSRPNEEEKTSKFSFSNKYGILTPYYHQGIGDTIKKILAKKEYDYQTLSEKIRLFYVALTRCRENMIILNKESENSKELRNCKTFKDLLDLVSPYFTYHKKINISSLNIHYKYLNTKEVSLSSHPIIHSIHHHRLPSLNQKVIQQEASKKVNQLFTKEERNFANKGTQLHKVFELFDFKNLNWDIVDSEEKIYLNQFLSQPLLKDIHKATIYKELPFIFNIDNNQVHGIIDLILEYEDHIDIIDYKLKHTQDIAYTQQLSLYKQYIQSLRTNKPVYTYLYSILDNHMILIESTSL